MGKLVVSSPLGSERIYAVLVYNVCPWRRCEGLSTTLKLRGTSLSLTFSTNAASGGSRRAVMGPTGGTGGECFVVFFVLYGFGC